MAQILGFAFAAASIVTALAMLLLVVWQAPRHRHNRLMALYLGTLLAWATGNLVARVCGMTGCAPDVFMYGAMSFTGINAFVLFWFVTDYVGLAGRAWVRALYVVGVLWLVVGTVGLYTGRLLLDLSLTPDGLWLYRLSPLAPPIFAFSQIFHLVALGCLWVFRRGPAGALLPGGVVLLAGKVVTVTLLPFLDGVPPALIAFTAAASVCFTYAILRENLFNPLARSQASLAVVLENTADPVWSVDGQRRLTSFNAAFRQLALSLTGVTPATGQDALELLPEEQRLFWSRLYERALRGEHMSVERRFATPGVPAHLEISFNPIVATGRTPSGAAVFARDVSAHARVIAEQSRAREAAEDASRAKSQFLASVSHELRMPLNAVLGFAQLLGDRVDGPLRPRQREFVESILTAGRHLLALINDLIDLSKIEAGKLDLAADRFTLGAELTQALWLLAPAARDKGLELIVDVAAEVPATLVGDPRRLRQVLVNLVGNAVKFTERGHVLVRVGRDAEMYGGVRLRFDVVDSGAGIPPEHVARVFEPFVHGEVRGEGPGRDGVGLGLAITRRLVEAMGGTIGVESSPGAGSTFSFVLPFVVPSDASVAAPEFAEVSVLVVDASDTRREILGRWLTEWRARPTLVARIGAARAALERARAAGASFAALLVDVDVDGGLLQLAARLGSPFAPIILMAAPTGDDGGDGIHVVRLRKPFSPDQLRACLATALSGDERAGGSSERRRTSRPLRILVAEDSLTNLAIASSLLERWGHTVTRTGHGRAAVAAVHDAPYDLVLMDVRMPGIDGLEATRLIRAGERTTTMRIPIVAMTASAMKGDRERCLEAGMDGYLAKPIDADELFEIVERIAAPTAGADGHGRGRGRLPDAVDVASLVDRLDGDAAAARVMGRLFLMEYARCMRELRAALDAHDAERVGRAANAVKGAIGTLSATGHDAAHRLELIAHDGDLSGAPAMLGLLEAELERLLPVVRKLADM